MSLLLAIAIGCGETGNRREPDPFAPQTTDRQGLVNVANDPLALLENGAVRGACKALEEARGAGRASERDVLLCGKEMFFYEGFGTLGVPAALQDFLMARVPEIGPSSTGVGLIEDPTSPDRRPIGFGAGSSINGRVPTLAFTCASCHVGRLPDGRFAVGAPNHDFQYGLLNLVLTTFPAMALAGPEGHDPLAEDRMRPILDRFHADSSAQLALLGTLFQLLPALGSVPPITAPIERAMASWRSGTMDFLMTPTFIDDGVHTVSKIPALWGVPDAGDVDRYQMDHALLGFTGVTHSLESFLDGFVRLGGGDVAAWPAERLEPLAAYVYSLRAPRNPSPAAPSLVAQGKALFESKGCLACHDGARGSSRSTFSFGEIGTEEAMKRWLDADLDGTPCCGVDLARGESVTHAIKAPRLVGLWAQHRFLHNGSVDSLDDLFCRRHTRPTIADEPFSDRGHAMTCDLDDDDKDALQAYLLAH